MTTATLTPTTEKTKKTTGKGEKDRAAAKKAGLSVIHYRVLKGLADQQARSYRDIEKKTGYYSVLTSVLRGASKGGTAHETSLGSLKLVREDIEDRDGRGVLVFAITAKGLKALEKAAKE